MSLEDKLYPFLKWYTALPSWLQSSVGRGYRLLPRAWRYGARYAEFTELARAGEKWSQEQIRDYQLKQLRIVLHHAANYCPYYERQFARSGFRPESVRELSDLKACPLLEKEDIQQGLEQIASSEIRRRDRLYITTGGSTGVPVPFYLQKGVSRPKEQAFLEAMWRRNGYFDGARVAVI